MSHPGQKSRAVSREKLEEVKGALGEQRHAERRSSAVD